MPVACVRRLSERRGDVLGNERVRDHVLVLLQGGRPCRFRLARRERVYRRLPSEIASVGASPDGGGPLAAADLRP